LRGAYVADAQLEGANLKAVDLRGSVLCRARLSDADLTRACLAGADLSGADLTDASLTGVDLSEARLDDADLSGADLTDAQVTRDQLCHSMTLMVDQLPRLLPERPRTYFASRLRVWYIVDDNSPRRRRAREGTRPCALHRMQL
jgi:hypothetical protein